MAGQREQIMQALLARLAAAYPFAVVGRRNPKPDSIARPGEPALFLLKHHEFHKTSSPSVPPKRSMTVMAMVYFDAGDDPNVIPDALINAMTDSLDAALRPDDPLSGRCTLGGLCESAQISGQTTNAPGDQTGKALAIIPIEIVLP